LRVAITGASGFVGMPLSKKLSMLGHEVLAISRSIPEKVDQNKIYWLKADLSIPENYQKEIKLFSPEVVIHLAWQDIPDFSFEKSKANLDLSLNFLIYIAEIGCCKKILFAGSCMEYNEMSGECLETETINDSKNHFTSAKNSLRKKAEKICRKKSICFVWFRIFYVYGPGQRVESLIPSIFKHLKNGRLPEINSPHNANDYIYIDDVVEAFSLAIINEISPGIYNLGTGISSTVIDVCRIAEKIVLNSSDLTRMLESKTISTLNDVNFWAGMTLTNEKLKFNPRVKLSDGIKHAWERFN
jgi:UDP-glucose 4-epimerase